MRTNSDQSDLSGVHLDEVDREFWKESTGSEGSVLRVVASPFRWAGRVRRPIVSTTLVVAATTALVLGLAGPASGAPSSVVAAETALARATKTRVKVDARLASARSRLSAVEKSVSRLGEEDEELTEQLAAARRSMREFAIAAYIDGGKSDVFRATLNPTKAQALAWQSTLSAGQSTSADEVARDFEQLKAQMSPKRVRAAEDLERARQALVEASNDAIQAAAFERDAEAALADARAQAREDAQRALAEEANSAASRQRNSGVASAARASRSSTSGSPTLVASTPQASSPAPESGAARGNPSSAESATLARIRRCESGGNYSIVSASGRYRGAYQFDYRTWAGMGGSGDPAAASPAEQDYRALLLLRQRGTRPWPVCGR